MKPTAWITDSIPSEFLAASRTLLSGDYMPKLRRMLDMLSEDDIWWRPNVASNSVGNLLLHLSGNLTQWIVNGVGGGIDNRERPAEFAERGPVPRSELMARVEKVVGEVDRVLTDVPHDTLTERITIQNFEVTRLHAIYHAVEHFGYHLGQIAYVVKLRQGKDLGIF